MPIALQFGPWAPDLANVPVQVPDNQGPMVVPCADCSNVYFANGAYQSIPSPAPATIDGNPIGVLPYPALNALSFFDNVQQQETVFVGCANGVQQLGANGVWAAIPLITSLVVNLSGQAFAFTAGNFVNTDRLAPSKLTFTTGKIGKFLAGVSIVAGTLTTYTKENLTGTPVLVTITVNGFKNMGAPVVGSCKGPQVLSGTMVGCYDTFGSTFAPTAQFSMANTFDPGQNAFNTLTANGKTYTPASASYSYFGGVATWLWTSAPFGFAPGSTYPIVFA